MNALTALLIHIPAADAIHQLTWTTKAAHPIASLWLSGQLWAWDGGDAVTVVIGSGDNLRCFFVIREGESVDVVEAESITKAMEERGYKVQVEVSIV